MRNCCKSLCIAERKQRNKRKKHRKLSRALEYQIDPNDSSVLILRNGTRIKQKQGLDLFLSLKGEVYALTKYGLRRRRVDYCRKRRYGLLSCNGVRNGRRYPYITFRNGTYRMHILMVEIWLRPRKEGEEVDHLDGNIDNFALENLEIVTREENIRRRKILNTLRRAAVVLHDPSLDPSRKSPAELARIYRSFTIVDTKVMSE